MSGLNLAGQNWLLILSPLNRQGKWSRSECSFMIITAYFLFHFVPITPVPSSEFKVAVIFTLNTVVQKKKSDEFLVHWTVAPTLPHSRAPTLEITLNHMLICRNEALFQILTIIINILNVSLFSVISAWTLLINHGLWIVTYEPWPMNHRKHLWRNIRVPLVSAKRMNSPLGLIFIANVEQTARIHFYPHYFSHLCSNQLTFIELR